ncbi:MAG: hypothetical protein PHS73_02280 [Candidatus Peribacteraceae bacterium]|nr:hypothetical protein [Candidatus Peribacteraceae bacterium]
MSPLFLAIGAWTLLILLLEGAFWLLFRHKFMQICLPVQGERIFFHFFTVGRLRIFAFVHTLILLILITVGHLLLWL